MKRITELNQEDIRKILAEHFNVSEDKVEVCPYTTSVGYGMQESVVTRVKAKVVEEG